MRILHYTPARKSGPGDVRTDLVPDELRGRLDSSSGMLWVDLQDRSDKHEKLLEQVFRLHPLVIDDVLREKHLPKVEDWGPYIYVVLHTIHLNRDQIVEVNARRLDAVMGVNYLLTLQEETLPEVEKIWERVQERHELLNYGAVYLVYQLADEILLGCSRVVSDLEQSVREVCSEIFHTPNRAVLKRSFDLRRDLLEVQGILEPQRDVLHTLARHESRLVDERAQVYFRDVYDHLARLLRETEQLHSEITGALEVYGLVQTDRSRELILIPTLITAVFFPLICVFTFFGVNFFAPAALLPAWVSYPLFILALILVPILPAVVIWWLRNKSWL